MSSRTSHLNKQGETESEGYEAGSHNKKADWLRGGHNRDDKEKKPTVAARGISETSGAVEARRRRRDRLNHHCGVAV